MKHQLFFALVAVLMMCGCTTEYYVSDAQHPDVAITAAGGVTFRGKFVDPEDLPGLLRRESYSRTDTIYISAPDDMSDWRLKRKVMAILSRNGFTRPVLVGEVHSFSEVGRTGEERRRDERAAREAKARASSGQQRTKGRIRYK